MTKRLYGGLFRSHNELSKGKHSTTFTQAKANQQCEELLTGILNSISGPIKYKELVFLA